MRHGNSFVSKKKSYYHLMHFYPGVEGGVLPILAYTERLCPKGAPFAGFRCIKGEGFHKLRYING